MKKQLSLIILSILFAGIAKSQSTETHETVDSVAPRTYTNSNHQPLEPAHYPPKYDNVKLTPHIYRDTRLGSSSPLYDTYIKNHYGAGAITTNPNKWGSGAPATFTPIYSTSSDSVYNNQIIKPVIEERKMTKRSDE